MDVTPKKIIVKKEKIEIIKLHDAVGFIRSRACVLVAKSLNNPERKAEADIIERRAASVERRLGRLRLKGARKYLLVPNPWKIHDIEDALDAIGATNEDRPENASSGGGRSR